MNNPFNHPLRTHFWYRVALLNLVLLATVGVLLRYKHFASIPWLHYKNFLHGHSHFAFAGWVSLALMAAIGHVLGTGNARLARQMQQLLWAQWLIALGMLISFAVQGYAAVSISFSTASIVLSYIFTAVVWRYVDVGQWGRCGALSLKAALLYMVLSSLGAFFLAGLMATQASTQPLYFAGLYFFLHFQYNGWFFFGIAALLLHYLHGRGLAQATEAALYKGMWWLVAACVPAVLLSGLWLDMPAWIYGIAVAGAVAQLVALFIWLPALKSLGSTMAASLLPATRRLWWLSLVALLLRLALQALSTVPALSKFAFAYRPVVIGYLHLILIGCISLFLLGWFFQQYLWRSLPIFTAGILIFMMGFLGTEITLMLQGFGYIGWVSIPHISISLLACAVVLWLGALCLWLATYGRTRS